MEITFKKPSQQRYEYMLVIDLPKELRYKIEKVRLQLTENYHIVQPQTGRPHISLVRFSAAQMMGEKMIHRLQLIAIAEKPFVIGLKDYGSYPLHAIFIEMVNQERVLQLIKNLKQARPLMKAAKSEPYFMEDPQIILAGRLPKEKYLEAMKEYLHKKFTAQFLAEGFLMLKRAEGEKRFQIVKRFEFQCLPISTTQGVLF